MKTYYIENTSGSLRNTLLIRKWMNDNVELIRDCGNFEWVSDVVWFTGEKATAEKLIDYLLTLTSDHIEIYDEDGNVVSSTHPVEDRGNPQTNGQYLCLVNEPLTDHIGVHRSRWAILYFINNEWKDMSPGSILRWLHLPRK